MRIFLGIDLTTEIRERIARFVEGVSPFAPDARWVEAASLHVTLKFIGEQKPEQVDAIASRLQQLASASFDIRFAGHGFFPTSKAPRVFWVGVQPGAQLAQLAGTLDKTTAELGIPAEGCPYSPHLTLARAGGRSGSPRWRRGDGSNTSFAVLEKRLATMSELDFGTMRASEFILYQSELSSKGSKYRKLQRFALQAR